MTNAEAWFNKSLRSRKPEGSLGRTAQDVHLDSHTAPEPCQRERVVMLLIYTGREFHTSSVLRHRVHLQQSHFSAHAGYFGVFVIHRTVTRTTGSLTCVCDLFTDVPYAHTRDLGLEDHPKDFYF